MVEIRKIGIDEIDIIKELFYSVFSSEPWYDDWSDHAQLHNYIFDLIGNDNSLSLGLFENDELIGISLGYILHWCAGTEYHIFEFCISTRKQGRGLGTQFIHMVEDYAREIGMDHIFLQTDESVPAYKFYEENGFKELKGHVSLVHRLDEET